MSHGMPGLVGTFGEGLVGTCFYMYFSIGNKKNIFSLKLTYKVVLIYNDPIAYKVSD